MRILMIAPTRADLPNVATEAAAVVNQHGGMLLQGDVDERMVRDAAMKGGFDGIWFATHSNATRVCLSRDDLDEGALVAYVAASGAKWVFFNSCESIYLGQRVVDQTEADVICTIVEAPDTLAMRTGVLFAGALAQSGSTRNAYERSKPGDNRTYVYLTSAKRRDGVRDMVPPHGRQDATPTDRLLDSMEELRRDVSEIAGEMKALQANQTAFRDWQGRIEARLGRIEDVLHNPQMVASHSTWQTWALLFGGLAVMTVLVMILIKVSV